LRDEEGEDKRETNKKKRKLWEKRVKTESPSLFLLIPEADATHQPPLREEKNDRERTDLMLLSSRIR
jgi:hypothetical protein